MAYDATKPLDDGYLAEAPAELRELHRALKEDKIVNAGMLNGYTQGNGSGKIPLNNGTLNTNLNADMLDGHDSAYFSASTHGHDGATTSAAGFMTTTQVTKLNGIATGAEVNQNAFSNVTVGSSTIQADGKTDTLTLVAGTGITLTADTTNDKVTIAGSTFVKSGSTAAAGLVPAPATTAGTTKYLREDCTWQVPPDTHWTSHLYAGASNGVANAATTNGNTYLICTDNSTARNRIKVTGSGATSVTSNADGVITINSTNTTYSNFVKSGSTAAAGLVPKPSTTAGTTKYLREDCTWQVPPDNNTTYSTFVKSGSTAAAGLVPKPSTTAGTTKYLREDCTWQVPPDNNTTYSTFVKSGSTAAAGLVPKPSTTAGTTKYLREDCTWQVPPDNNTVYTHPTSAGNKHIPAGGSSGQFLKWSAAGTAAWSGPPTLMGATRPTETVLFGSLTTKDSRATSGSVTLSQSWQNFDALLFVIGPDAADRLFSVIVPVWELAQRMEIAQAMGISNFGLFAHYNFCYVTTGSTNTKFVASADNCVIYAIVGLKL